MPEHISYLRKLSRMEERHSDRPSLFKAKQLLNEEIFLSLSLSKKALHIYNQKCHWKYTLHIFKSGYACYSRDKTTGVKVEKIPTSALANWVSVSKRKGHKKVMVSHGNSKWNQHLSES